MSANVLFCGPEVQNLEIFSLLSYMTKKNSKTSHWSGWNQRTLGILDRAMTVAD